jgi:hypothetical protein
MLRPRPPGAPEWPKPGHVGVPGTSGKTLSGAPEASRFNPVEKVITLPMRFWNLSGLSKSAAQGVPNSHPGETMKLPIDQSRITALVTGEPRPVLVYGTDETRTDKDGRPLFRIPVLLSGTTDTIDPTTTVTVPGPIEGVAKGQSIRFRNLTIGTWAMRDASGRERHGVTLRADGVENETKPSR